MAEIEYKINENGCHICTSHSDDGYGYPKFKRNGKTQRIYRFLWKEKYGEIEDDLVLRHSCDNRMCINIEHLSLGTRQDNMNDMVERKRSCFGTKNRGCKLTEEQVISIRESSLSVKELSEIYNVGDKAIRRIINRQSWKHI